MADDPRVIVAVADHLFKRDTLIEADQLAKAAPEQLTDVHLAHLAPYVSPRELAALLQRRADAIDRRAAEAFAAAQARATTPRQAAAPDTPPDVAHAIEVVSAAIRKELSFAEICEAAGDQPAIVTALLVQFVSSINEKNKERNAKLAALEARVLELEAPHAAAGRS